MDLGLTAAEAEVYTCLVRTGVRTGYRVAKALGKPAANVYQALRSLRAKGAIVVDEGETQQCRAVAPAELLDRLEREFRATRRRAADAFSRLPVPAPDDRQRRAAVSTFPNTYSGIPHEETFDELRDDHGCALLTTMGLADGEALVVEFEG